MRMGIIEEINKIRGLMFNGKKIVTEQTEPTKVDEPKKADLVNNSVNDFFKSLTDIANSGGLTQQNTGSMTYQKSVETLQIALQLLGYQLPKYGVDGLFGPETASAVTKFLADNPEQVSEQLKLQTGPVKIDKYGIEKIIKRLRSKGVRPEDLNPFLDTISSDDGNDYTMLINRYAQVFGVNPLLVKSVIHVESKWNPNAKSDAGAIGLMQLMPNTARGLGVNPYVPAENIKGGTKYLSQLLKQFNNNVDYALKAYNWGSGNMSSYLKTGRGTKGQEMPEETIRYTAKVVRAYNNLQAQNNA
jgi:peptidoglycan hydrolase-like protein with peptidoglycan-binding domain